MPKSLIETSIDKATNENNVVDDWGLIFEIVDQINQSNGEKEAIRLFVKKLNDKDPHVIKHTLTLLNACVTNCERAFKLEVCSRTFVEELRNFVLKKRFPKLSTELAIMIEKWQQENDFKKDPALNLIPSLYNELKKSGIEFKPEFEPSTKNMKIDASLAKKEEEELARAIQLSLKETSGSGSAASSSSSIKTTKTPNNSASSLFGSLSQQTQKLSQSYSNNNKSDAKRKVKALYDFEAVEDNEITFKSGDIILLTDDSDQNWWKGIDSSGFEGLFPSNFVTFDLNEKLESFENYTSSSSSNKKVSFNDKVNVNLIENNHKPHKIVIDEKKIDKCIDMLQNADPTGEIQPDTQELLELEDECYMMGPLIDQKLQQIDQKHAQLEDLNMKVLEAFQLYTNLMKESITKTTTSFNIGPSTSSMYNMNQQPPINNFTNPILTQPTVNNGQINYMSAPPTIDQNSMYLANQLSSLALNGPSTVLQSQTMNIQKTIQNQIPVQGLPAQPQINQQLTQQQISQQIPTQSQIQQSLQTQYPSQQMSVANSFQPNALTSLPTPMYTNGGLNSMNGTNTFSLVNPNPNTYQNQY